MTEQTNLRWKTDRKTTLAERIAFRMMSFVHEDVYRLVRDPYLVLDGAGLEEGQTVLEVGCGPGFFTVPAARIVGDSGRVYALDISPLAIEKVRRKVNEAGVSNVEIVLADAARTELPDEAFDLAFLLGLARPVGEIDNIWTEVYRLLKPGGILAVEGRLDPPGDLFHALRQQARIKVFQKTEQHTDHERVSSQSPDLGRTQRRYQRRVAKRWHWN